MLIREMCCATDIGTVRKTNQDSVAVYSDLNLAVLADGMGGHLAGEVASRKAIEVVRDAVSEGASIVDAVVRANSEVFALAENNSEYTGMGTTLVAALYDGLKVKIVNVGDSRLYLYRKGILKQITVDQTVAQELRDRGLEHKNGKHISTYEHVLTNALGIQEKCGISISNEVVQPGDVHLLCSDGLTGMLDDELVSGMLAKQLNGLEGMLQSLISAALQRAAQDNVSAAMIRSKPPIRGLNIAQVSSEND
jgi:serine/threonine protein phosphatase PrpC